MAELIWNEEEIQHIDSLKELGLQKLTLDINRRIEPKFAKENDTKSRGLDIQVKKDNKVIDTTGVVLKMYAMPVKEQEVYEIESTVIDASRGKYEIIYPTVILQAGTTLAEIVLLKDEQVISSKKFKIEVESRLLTDDVVKGHDAYPLFEQLLEAAKTIEGVDIATEEEREKNEIIRQTQEQQRQESMTDIEHRFNLLETSKQQDAEVINARTSTIKNKTFDSLNDRLEEAEKDIDQAEQNAKQYTNTEIEKVNNKIDKPLYSTPVETYDNVIHLPENTTNGQVSGSVRGNTYTNLLGSDGSGRTLNNINAVRGTRTQESDYVKFTPTDIQEVDSRLQIMNNFKSNRVYFVSFYYTLNTTSVLGLKISMMDETSSVVSNHASINNTETWERIGCKITPTSDANRIIFQLAQGRGMTDILKIKKIIVVDITGEENIPEDELLKRYKYIDDTKHTIGSMRIKSIGQNKLEDISYITAKDKDNKIVNLNRVGDVADEIDLDSNMLIKKTKEIILNGSEDWYRVGSAPTANSLTLATVIKDISQGGRPSILYNNEGNFRQNGNTTIDEPFIFDIDYSTGYIFIKIPITTGNLQDGIDYLKNNPLTLIYKLAEPEIIPVEIEGEIQGYENGTVYFTPYIKDRFVADDTLTIKLQYPIKAIDKLLKLDTENAKWIEVEGTLSEDGQTITVSEKGTYKVYGEIQEGYSTNGLKTIITPINLNGQINSNTTAIEKINNKIYTDADLFTAMLLQQEVRITALEQGGVI